jgi:hypothetical protein
MTLHFGLHDRIPFISYCREGVFLACSAGGGLVLFLLFGELGLYVLELHFQLQFLGNDSVEPHDCLFNRLAQLVQLFLHFLDLLPEFLR